ncbi:MAG: rhodanese-like domain-containing protein [Leeuwenhoekiella sp.]
MTTLLLSLPLLLGFFHTGNAQQNIDGLLKKYNNHSIPYISVEMLKMNQDNYVLLDTRKKEEYAVSHLADAIWVGEDMDDALIASLNLQSDQSIVVYCTVGIRSEKYGIQLKDLGYTHVNNLYGSIFAWKDAGFPVFDANNHTTEQVHVYSKMWGKYLKNGKKIY